MSKNKESTNKPKVLIFDIETSLMTVHTFGIGDQYIDDEDIIEDWQVLSYSAKWLENEDGTIFGPHNKMMYEDQRKNKGKLSDKKLLKGIWELLDEADIVLTQNGKKFDSKKLNARFVYHKMAPPSPYRHIDTLQINRKNFGFTSNKLRYVTKILCTKYKKLSHKKFPGKTLWKECQKGNIEAWKEMELYNKYDVLSLEEMYHRVSPFDTSINFNVYDDESLDSKCRCGGALKPYKGFVYNETGKFARYKCVRPTCGASHRSKVNLLTKEKRASLTK